MCKKVAVILAGGKGTRLRPYTIAMPKPLVPVGDKPILEIIINQLKKGGFTDVYMAVNHQADLIEAYFGDGSKYGLNISYYLEDKPLGTMGPLKLMEKDLPDDFLVMNGDVLSDMDYSEFLESHINSGKIYSIASYIRKQSIEYGVLNVEECILKGFTEKPSYSYNVSMGVYAAKKSVIQYIPEDTYYGFDSLMKELLRIANPVAVKEFTGYWLDIGRPEDYEKACEDIETGRFVY